jgi:hypothetical protein
MAGTDEFVGFQMLVATVFGFLLLPGAIFFFFVIRDQECLLLK